MMFENMGFKTLSQRHGKSLKSFLEVFCFNLTEHKPLRSHSEPIQLICFLIEIHEM